MRKNILIVAGDAVESLEMYYPYFRLQEAGYDVTIAAPSVKKIQTVLHDFLELETYTEKAGYLIDSEVAFQDIDMNHFDALYIPGGRAPEYIALYSDLASIIAHFFETGKPVAMICHGVLALGDNQNLIKNKEVTAYPACQSVVKLLGARYSLEKVVLDGNLVSAQDWSDLPVFMKTFIQLLEK